jgi:hypothetical protein
MSSRKLGASSKSASKARISSPYLWQMPFVTFLRAHTLPIAHDILVPSYKSAVYPNLTMIIDQWDDGFSAGVREISAKRAENRVTNYVDPVEVDRAVSKYGSTEACTIRFGVKKPGHGYHKERGDFCLLGGSLQGKHLQLFYRSLELIGGLAYDLCIINHLTEAFDVKLKSVTIHAAKANVFALKGNSNEKLYPKFRKVLGL